MEFIQKSIGTFIWIHWGPVETHPQLLARAERPQKSVEQTIHQDDQLRLWLSTAKQTVALGLRLCGYCSGLIYREIMQKCAWQMGPSTLGTPTVLFHFLHCLCSLFLSSLPGWIDQYRNFFFCWYTGWFNYRTQKKLNKNKPIRMIFHL